MRIRNDLAEISEECRPGQGERRKKYEDIVWDRRACTGRSAYLFLVIDIAIIRVGRIRKNMEESEKDNVI